jgi:hypothetical protein
MKASNEEIFDFIATSCVHDESKLKEILKKRFKKTDSEAQQLIWAYHLR